MPPEEGTPEVLVHTNFAVNPSFESIASTTDLHRNLIRDPDMQNLPAWSATAGGITLSSGNRLTATSNGNSTVRLGASQLVDAKYPAGTYVLSADMEAPDASLTTARVILLDVTGSVIRATTNIPKVSTGVNRYDFTLTATGEWDRVYIEFTGAAIPTGAVVNIGRPIIGLRSVPVPFFSGTTPVKEARNIGTNPQANTVGPGWSSNNAASYPVTRNVTPPIPHPLGIPTAAMSSNSGVTVNGVIMSLYNVDGLAASGTPTRSMGVWVLVNEPGYRMMNGAGGVTWPQDEIPANVWTYVKTLTPVAAGNNATVYVTKITGNASLTARAYATGLTTVEGSVAPEQSFDGSYSQHPGFIPVWEGAANSSASYLRNGDLFTVWSGAANGSYSILRGQRPSGVNTATSNANLYQSSEWFDTGSKSIKVDPTGGGNNSYGSVIISGLTPGQTYTAVARIRLEKEQTGTLNATWQRQLMAQSTGMVQNNVLSNRAPNTPGVHDLRVEFTPVATTATIFLMNGSLLTPVWFDSLGVIDGQYAGPYFSGSTPAADGLEYRWVGVENASISQMFIPQGEMIFTNYCDINWFQDNDQECTDGIMRALEAERPYEAQYLGDEAPWFSRYSGYTYPGDPSHRFLGIYGLSADSLSDSTRTVGITEGILSGGVLGRERLAVPRFRFRVMLTAVDQDGLEYGKAWLSKALSEQSCGTHGPSCGSSDITFFTRCPSFERDFNGPIQAYNEKVDLITRVYHDVKCIAGPVTIDQFDRGANGWGAIVEFELAAGVPTMFGKLNAFIPISQDGETVISDVPMNEIKFPSAEVAQEPGGMNPNPSLEVNTTGWSGVVAAVSGTNPNPYWTLVRSNESAFQGTYSFRGLIQGTTSSANLDGIAKATLQAEIDATALADGSPIMASAYGRFGKYTGELSDAHLMQGFATWKTAANANVGSPIPMGTVDVEPALSSWNSFSAVTLKPATATKLVIEIQYTFLWNTGPLGIPSRIPIFMDLADSGPILPVSTNYSLNPSVETNATGWNFATTGQTSGQVTAGRVTGELSASGTASYRSVLTVIGVNSNVPGGVLMWQDVDISARPAGVGVSYTIWSAQSVVSGSAVRLPIAVRHTWLDSGGTAIGSAVVAGEIPLTGGAFSARSLTPPAGAARLRVEVVHNFNSWVGGTVVRMYTDALAVTVP